MRSHAPRSAVSVISCHATRNILFSDNSTHTKMTILNVLFKECSIPDEALTFDLLPIQNSIDDIYLFETGIKSDSPRGAGNL